MTNSSEQALKMRICPICNERNFGESIVCELCNFSLGDVDFIDSSNDGASKADGGVQNEQLPLGKNNAIETEKPENNQRNLYETVVERASSLTFVSIESGKSFQAKNGAILGRTNVGGNEVFDEIDTVSRVHAKIYWDGINWEIEDCSKNGTCISGTYLTKGIRYRIKKGDTIHFSSQCTLMVST